MKRTFLFLLLIIIFSYGCSSSVSQDTITSDDSKVDIVKKIKVGAENLDDKISSLKGKKIGLVVNHTSFVGEVHLLDYLREKGLDIVKIFSPEHGFRGKANAGEKLDNSIDEKTKLPIISLYGKHRKPTKEDLEDLDVMIFDIQDVGVRFYTYISTMHYVMESCAENNKKCIILDRPNPNGHYVDGPIREDGLESFVSMHPIPIVHGLTIGELAGMINGEKWLADGEICDLEVVKCLNYTHDSIYDLPINPSPNLPNMRSIYLYPSLCLIEGTNVSIGRGTDKQFQIYGHPKFNKMAFTFTPEPNEGSSKPKLQGKLCYGVNLKQEAIEYRNEGFQLIYLQDAFNKFGDDKKKFWMKSRMFDLLAGTTKLKEQITNEISERQIRKTWEPALSNYKEARKKYLLYP